MKVPIIRHEKDPGLFISIPHLLDGMSEFDRRELVAFACQDGVFMEAVCSAVATNKQDTGIEPSGHWDCWFPAQVKTRLRLALVALLDEAVGVELEEAVAKAAKYERAHRHLESLARIEKLQRDEDDWERKSQRRGQWDWEYHQALAMFPQYAATKEATAQAPTE